MGPVGILRYISHPDVHIDPDVPVPQWSLNEQGRRRTQAMLAQPWLAEVGRVVSSAEVKALETADIVARHLDLPVEVRPDSGETDRSSTGVVSHERHEALADKFFAEPNRSADGWETAKDAQARIVAALADLIADDSTPISAPAPKLDVVVVGHGGVGTLLLCHLSGLEIDRRHDQSGSGHVWSYDRTNDRVLHRWHPIDLEDT